MSVDARALGWRSLVGLGRRSELAVAAAAGAMLAVIAFTSVAAPRLLADAETESLDLAIAQAPASARQLTIRLIDDFGPGFNDDPLEAQREALSDIAAEIDAGLLDRFGPARFIADTSRFSVIGVDLQDAPPDDLSDAPAPALPTFLTFRVHPELAEHSTLVAGRPATRTDRRLDDMRVFEFELATESAVELGWELGDTVLLTTDPTDLVTRQFSGGLPDQFVAELVGLRELTPPDEGYWFGDARLHRPTVADTGTGANVFAFAMVAPDQLPTRPFVIGRRSPYFLEQRRDLVAESVTLDNAADTLAGLTALEASFSTQPTLSRPGVTAALGPVLEIELDQRRAARSTLVLAAVGVFGVALTTLTLLLLASLARRRGWLTVARARGASRSQLVIASMAEAAIVATVAMAVGGGVAALVIGGPSSSIERALVSGLWLGSVGAAGLLAAAEGMRPVTVSARPTAHPGLGRWGRVGGWFLIVVAAAAVVTFRRRGLAIDAPSVDPLIVLLPVLVPLAIVYLTRWILPFAVRQISDRGLALGLGRLVGLRRVVDQPESTVGIVTVLVLSLTVGALGLGVNRSLDQGAVDASWTAVGAPYRIDTRDMAVAGAIGEIPDAVVAASGSTRINVERGDTTFSVQFISVDIPELSRITAGTAADERYPDQLAQLDVDGRIPVVASQRMGGVRIRVGDVFDGLGSRVGQTFVVVETRAGAFGRRNDWLVADRGAYSLVAGTEPGFNSLAIDVPEGSVSTLRDIAGAASEELDDRFRVLELQRDDPLSRVVRRGYLVAGLLAALLALLALIAVSVVTARDRRREVAIIGLLGADRREISRAVASELVPATVAGTMVGAAVGWLVVGFYDGRYDLSAFAAGTPVSIGGDLVGLLALSTGMLVAAVAVVAVLVRRIVHARASEILRIDGAA